MLPQTTFDSTGAELDPRSGKRLKEELLPSRNGLMYQILFIWRGKFDEHEIVLPHIRKLDRKQIETNIQKFYPGQWFNVMICHGSTRHRHISTAPVHEETIQEKKDHEYSKTVLNLKRLKTPSFSS